MLLYGIKIKLSGNIIWIGSGGIERGDYTNTDINEAYKFCNQMKKNNPGFQYWVEEYK